MSENKINKNIRYYLPNDPYYYEVDNLPLKDLLDNDERLQTQVDTLRAEFDVVQGRSTFGELKPFSEAGNPGRIFVNPGNFMARVDSGSDRYTGLEETQDISDNSNPDTLVNTIDIETENAQDIAGGSARTALVRLHKHVDGTIPSVALTAGVAADYPEDANSAPPAYRLDLVYVKGTKAEDQDGGAETGATLGVVRGAYFIKGPNGFSGRSGSFLPRNGAAGSQTMIQNVNDVPPDLIQVKTNPTDGRPLYTTVPTPDLTLHHHASMAPIAFGDGTSIDMQDLAQYLDANENSSMGCPVAYVLVPFNYIEGTHIPEENIIDVRPFFRTNELTLPERQAIATADVPSILNPFMTAKSTIKKFSTEVARSAGAPVIQTQIDAQQVLIENLQDLIAGMDTEDPILLPKVWVMIKDPNSAYVTTPIFLEAGEYIAQVTIQHGVGTNITRTFRWGVNYGAPFNVITQTTPNAMYRDATVNNDDDTIASQSLYFTVTNAGMYQCVCPQPRRGGFDGANFNAIQRTVNGATDIVGWFTKVSRQYPTP